MDVLTDNPLANMPGPLFLMFYFVLAAASVVTVYFAAEPRDDRPLPALPQTPDPYPIAYLREGYPGVAWLAIYALKRAGFLTLTAKGQLEPQPQAGRPAHPCEAAMLSFIGKGRSTNRIGAVATSILRPAFAPDRKALEAQGLVRDAATRWRAGKAAAVAALLMSALAIYKLYTAHEHGRRNVEFLLGEWIVTLFLLLLAGSLLAAPRANARGRAYLNRIKLAYGAGPAKAKATASREPAALVALAAVGFTLLAGTPEEAFAKQVRKSGGGDSGGCGSGSSCSSSGGGDGGGGCGGCGGGD